jgi:hypothetical protein
MIWHGSSRLGCVVPVRSFWWFSKPFLGDFLGTISRPFSLGFGGECMHEPSVVLFPLIPLTNLWAKGLDFGVFGALGLETFLWDFLDSSWFSKFWWTKSWLWSAHEVFLLSPKSCTNPWSDSRDRELDLGELTRGSCSSPSGPAWPVWPVQRLCGFCLGWTSGWVRCCPVLLLFPLSFNLELGRPIWWIWGFWLELVWSVSYTVLTGVGAFCGSS